MRKFNTGNVFKLHGSISIVTGERTVNDKKVTDWVCFEYENTSGTTPNITDEVENMCWDCQTNVTENPDYECQKCYGTGYYMKERLGMDKAIFLAPTVKKYILARLLKNFEF
jgi:hypothetical protein